ncbi:imidazolonepropionase, partial [Pseudomonas sp. 2588-5]
MSRGLGVEEEARHARLAAEHVDTVTFLGAHLVPKGVDAAAYIDSVTGPMLEAALPYVDWADVFCETGAFSEEQSRT